MKGIEQASIENLFEIAYNLAEKLQNAPQFVISSGSGFSEIWEKFDVKQVIGYSEIKGMPQSNIQGHRNELYLIEYDGKIGIVFGGRFHLYDGYILEQILIPVIIPYLYGVKDFIFFNAAGGLNHRFEVGDIMIIEDAINFTSRKIHPLFNKELFVNKNFASDLYSKRWIQDLENRLINNSIKYQKGTYIEVTGPTYETRAEVKMFRNYGGDAMGMSTVLESLAASLLNAKVLGISIISNLLTEIKQKGTSHEDVIQAISAQHPKIEKTIKCCIESIEFEDN
jgi:purine-nucleoside phosphorylase